MARKLNLVRLKFLQEDGLETVEWMGLVVVIAVLLLAVAGFVTAGDSQIGQAILDVYECNIRAIGSSSCGGAGPIAGNPGSIPGNSSNGESNSPGSPGGSNGGAPDAGGPSVNTNSSLGPDVWSDSNVKSEVEASASEYETKIKASRTNTYDPETGRYEQGDWTIEDKSGKGDVTIEGTIADWHGKTGAAILAGETGFEAQNGDGSLTSSGEVRGEILSGEVGGGGNLAINKDGLKAEVDGKAGVYVGRVQADIEGEMRFSEDWAVGAGVEGEAYVGAEVNGAAGVLFGRSGVGAQAGVEAFGGGKAEVEGKLSSEIAGVEAAVLGRAGVSYGLGAKADFTLKLENGKLIVKEELSLTIGLGLSEAVGIEIDLAALGKKGVELGKKIWCLGPWC